MKTALVVFLSTLVSLNASATSRNTLSVVRGALDYEICSSGSVEVYAADLKEVLFEASPRESIVPLQSFRGPREKVKIVKGRRQTFVSVQFAEAVEDEENIGWVEKRYVKPSSNCDELPTRYAAPVENPGNTPTGNKVSPLIKQVPVTATGIESDGCCVFPTSARPTESYLDGMRQFGWSRPHGRVHAACDLYRPLGDPVVAIADGKVIFGPIKFYLGTYEIEVLHPGGVIARYGEVIGKVAPGIRAGAPVKAGQVLGYVGKTTAVPMTMLHFELYAGSAQGPLTSRRNKGFERRSDLINPTPYLETWERKTFGSNAER